MQMVHFIPPSQRRLAMLAAQADAAPALVLGGSGTGKGVVAKWIHQNGPRAAKPLVEALRDIPLGQQIADAQGGTILVPEIGQWPLGEQRVLLNFLNTRTVSQNGTAKLVNARVIATSEQGLEGRAQGGLFNSELLAKLNVFRLEMPPLIKRKDEFEDIAQGILSEIAIELRKDHLRDFSTAAWKRLLAYDWPGNLRELRNVIRMAVTGAAGDQIEDGDVPDLGESHIDFRATREQFERIYLLELLNSFDWDVEKTCERSRMDRPMLEAKILQYGLKRK